MERHEMQHAVARLFRRQHGAAALHQLLALGVTHRMVERRVRNREWLRLAPGVYSVATASSTWQRQYWAAALSLPGSSVASLAAAKVQSFEGFGVAKPELLVGYTANHRTPLATVHRSADALTTTVDGLPVTTVAQTFVDVLPVVSGRRWEAALDAALISKRLTIDELQERRLAYDKSRRPRIALLRAMVDERLDVGFVPSASPLEIDLKETVKLIPGCPPVTFQASAPWNPTGKERVDALIEFWRLILEADSRTWHARLADFERDRERDNRAAAAGYRVLRFTRPHLTVLRAETALLIAEAGRTTRLAS